MSYGCLIIITGPMFAGKSSSLIAAIINKKINETIISKPLVYKHLFDGARYGKEFIMSHDKKKVSCELLDDEKLKQLPDNKKIEKYDWIFIDEAQFFNKEIIFNTCKKLLKQNKNICCVGLNQDSFGMPFGAMGDLMTMADDILLLKARCEICDKPASKTQRLKTKSKDIILVDGASAYQPRCLLHWTSEP